MIISDNNYSFIIKYIFIIIIYSNTIFFDFIKINIEKKNLIEIDNEFILNLYENEKTFIKSKIRFKAIALYYPEYNNISYLKLFNNYENSKCLDINEMKRLIITQTKLAKDHEIYGFAIFFKLFKKDNYVQMVIKIFLNIISFPFFLIWRNDELENVDENVIIFLINYLKKFIISENYIKIKEKPILSINKPNKIANITKLLFFLRKKAKKEFGEVFILYPFTGNFKLKEFLWEFDATYDFSKIDLLEDLSNSHNFLYYSGNIYKNLYLNELDINFPLFRTCYANKNFKDFRVFDLNFYFIA